MMKAVRIFVTLASLLALLALACSAGAETPSSGGVVIEPGGLGATPVVGGKPDPQAVAPGALAGSAPTPAAAADTQAPQTGHWIDVDVTRYRVRLMDGTQTLKTIEPVAV